MGTATNQIATEKDLYYSGFTNFASSGASGALGVTYEDLQKIKDAGFVQSVPSAPLHEIWSNIHNPAYNESVSFNVFPQSYTTPMVISQWDVGPLSDYDSVTFPDTRCGMFQISVTNSGAASAKVYLYLTFDNSSFTAGTTTSTTNVKYVSTTTVTMGQTVTISSCIHSVLGTSATTAFKGKKTCQWVIVCINTAPLSGGMYTTLSVKQNINNATFGSLGWIDSKKLVKYLSCAGSDKSVKIPFYLKISESVTGATRANKITFYYSYMDRTNGYTGTIHDIPIGEWNNDGNNVNGSAEKTDFYLEVNPHYILKQKGINRSDVSSSWLMIECGTTNNKQNWTILGREKSTTSGTQGTWITWDTKNNATSADWGLYSLTAIKYPENYTGEVYGDKYFLQGIKEYNGVEFKIDN